LELADGTEKKLEDKRYQDHTMVVNSPQLKQGFLPIHNEMFSSMRCNEDAIFKANPTHVYPQGTVLTVDGTLLQLGEIKAVYYRIILSPNTKWKRPEAKKWQDKLICSVADREDAKKLYMEMNFDKALALYRQALVYMDNVKEELESSDYKKMQLERSLLVMNISKALQAQNKHSECVLQIERVVSNSNHAFAMCTVNSYKPLFCFK